MNKSKLKKLIAVCFAFAGAGVFALGGCAKHGDSHTHTWTTKYYSDGADGHYRLTMCLDHATERSANEEHDGDTCSKCGYVKEGDGTVSVTSVEISGKTSVKVSGHVQLTATVLPENATSRDVTWTIIAGGDCAQIDDNGLLTGVAKGSVTVKATAGGVSDTYGVEVVENTGAAVAVTSVTLDKGTLELTAGDTATLNATVNPDDADDQSVTWSSDNTAAATVKNGVVTAVSAGTATITVTTNDGGHTATCQVKVNALNPGKDPSKPSDPLEKPDDPVIKPVQGGPTITKASAGELEAAYVEWTAATSADRYNVYVSPEGKNNWTKLDAPLVRQYSTYYRADAVGLKAGSYDMKVVPVDGSGTEATDYSATAEKITVYAHERAGFGFVNGTSSGAYNEDGTLKEDAIVLYVTNENYDKITLQTGKGLMTGIDNILGEGYLSSKGDNKPLCVRIIGSIGNGSKLGFKADGDLELKGLTQGVTVEGIGNDATANGWGFHVTGCSNVEIRNIGVMNMMGGTKDGIGFENKCDHVWVHNCDIFYGNNWGGDQKKGDGSLDTKQCTYVTHSYNHFWDTGKCNLQGMKEKGDFKITYHHNWYDHSDSRHPRIRTATVHIYNNYFDGNAKYGVGVTLGASAFVENNYFRSTARMKPMLSSMQGTDIAHGKDGQTFSSENGGIIKSYGNHFEGPYELLTQKDTEADNIDCYEASSRSEQVPANYVTKQGGTTYNNFDTAEDMYEYSVDTPEQAKTKVTRYAGRVDGGDLKFVFDNATQDSNSDIIPELANKLTQYANTLTLIKIGKDD